MIDPYECCPHCGDFLWHELGYDSPQQYAMDCWYMYTNNRYLYIVDITNSILEVEDVMEQPQGG